LKILAYTFCSGVNLGRLALIFLFSALLIPGCRKKDTTEPIEIIDIKSQPMVRVLLIDNTSRFDFKCAKDISVTTNPNTDISKAILSSPQKQISISVEDESITIGNWTCMAGELEIAPDSNSIFSVNGQQYRGHLKIMLNSDSNSFDVVNVLGIEKYLAGVVGSEMPSYWEAAALDAQTIASRTYCLYIKERFGNARNWDVKKTAANQVYRGVNAESKQVWQAVGRTAGEVLFCKGSDGKKGIFPAYYSSTCGGNTETSENVFGDSFKSLKAVRCEYCKKIAKKEWLNWSDIRIEKSKLNNKLMTRYRQLKKLEMISEIIPEKKSEHNGFVRIAWIKLVGTNGQYDTLRGEDFRLAVDPTGFKLKSNSFTIKDDGDSWLFTGGKGLGHGVGMCQCGAEGMARKGKKANEILSHYYPGAKIKKLY
jgi:stage II sporulation protein D